MQRLHITTCLAENAFAFCHDIKAYLEASLNMPVSFDTSNSVKKRTQNISTGNIQLSWICGLLYTVLKDQQKANIVPLATPVCTGDTSPLYTSYQIVRKERQFKTFAALRGTCLAINEAESFSGYTIIKDYLLKTKQDLPFFDKVIKSDSHMQSIDMILNRQADSAAIDSTVFEYWAKHSPDKANELRIIESLGAFPMPPWVVWEGLEQDIITKIQQVLLAIPKPQLAKFGFETMAEVNDANYNAIRQAAKLTEQTTLF